MKMITGTPAANGMVLGEIKVVTRRDAGLNRVVKTPEKEKLLFDAACLLAKDEIEYLVQNADGEEKAIFEFQKSMLEDQSFLSEVNNYVFVGAGAAAAVERASRIFEKKMKEIDDDYFKQRADDIKDACHRVVDILDGRLNRSLTLEKPIILVADDILPSDLMGVDRHNLLGFITSAGSPQSHAAIIARTLGVPAVVMASVVFSPHDSGKLAAVDGKLGAVYLEPDDDTKKRFIQSIKRAKQRKKVLEKLKDKPCITLDGTQISLMANCSSIEDVATAMEYGADGIGLVRSEFIISDTGKIPSEQEQYEFYKQCVRLAKGKPVTIRTFDFGGDKPMPNVIRHSENNPALGLRGLRLCLEKPQIFKPQIKALLRAGQHGKLNVMIPMVTTISEVDQTKVIWNEAIKELEEQAVPFSKQVKFGIMVETPAAALRAEELANAVDFFNIGTNDLIQYTHAVDRTNPAIEKYHPSYSKAVERLLRMVIDAASTADIPVCLCGEMATNEILMKNLLRIGIRSISMSASWIPEIKDILINTNLNDI